MFPTANLTRLLGFTALLVAFASGVSSRAQAPLEKAGATWSIPWDADWVTAVTFVGNNRIVAGNNLGEIMLWELPNEPSGSAPKPLRRFEGHSNVITRLLTTPDGRWLISSSNDHTIRFWDLKAPEGKKAMFVVNSRAIGEAEEKKKKAPAPIEFPIDSIGEAKSFKGHKDWVVAMSLSKDGNTLASGDEKGEVIIWDVPSGAERKRWKLKGWVWALALTPEADAVAVSERIPLVFDSGRYSAMKIWNVNGELKLDLSKAVDKQVVGVAQYSPDGKTLALGRGGEANGQSGKITLMDASTGKILKETSPGHLDGMTDVLFHPDGKLVVSAGRDTLVRVWDVESAKLVKEFGVGRGGQFKDWICAIAFSPDARWLAGADMAGQVQIWNMNAPNKK